MRRIQLYSLLLLIVTAGAIHAQPNNWVKRNGFDGSKRERCIGIAIGNRGYLGFGHDSGTVVRNDWWEYDPGTDTWTQKASLPASGRRDAIGFAIGTKGYVGCGDNSNDANLGNPLADFWEYNPATNSWTSKANCPVNFGGGVYYATGFAVNGRGYVCCGKVGPSNYLNQLWEYNPGTNSWAQRANFPGGPRYGMSSFVTGSVAYAGLGVDYNVLRRDWWKYDPALNQWTQAANFPGTARYSASSFAIGPDGFLVFGTDGGYKAELWEFSSTYNVWAQRADCPGEPRRSGVAFTIGNKGYAGTGKAVSGSKRDFYEYTPMAPMGEDELENTGSLSIYPNPMSSNCQVSISTPGSINALQLDIIDLSGKIVRSLKPADRILSVERENLDAGLYFISLKKGDRILTTSKLVIQ